MSTRKDPSKVPVSHRKRARKMAVQALYQWHFSGGSAGQIINEFAEENDLHNVDVSFFKEALERILSPDCAFDDLIVPHLDRELHLVDPVELSVIRLAVFELSERIDVPYRVVINEAIELAKQFGGTDGHKFVNGIVDKLCNELRATEVSANAKMG